VHASSGDANWPLVWPSSGAPATPVEAVYKTPPYVVLQARALGGSGRAHLLTKPRLCLPANALCGVCLHSCAPGLQCSSSRTSFEQELQTNWVLRGSPLRQHRSLSAPKAEPAAAHRHSTALSPRTVLKAPAFPSVPASYREAQEQIVEPYLPATQRTWSPFVSIASGFHNRYGV